MFKTTKLAGLVKSKEASDNKKIGSSSSIQITAVTAIAVATFWPVG